MWEAIGSLCVWDSVTFHEFVGKAADWLDKAVKGSNSD